MAREFELNQLCNLLLSVVHFTAVQVVQSQGWGGGVFLGIRGGAVSPGSPISDKRIVIFNKRFQTWRRHKFCYHYLDENANQTFLKIHFQFAYSTLSFLLVWN